MYLNPRVQGSIPTEGKNSTSEGVEKIVRWQYRDRLARGPDCYNHDNRRKDLEFSEGDHVFLKVNPVTGVGRALKS